MKSDSFMETVVTREEIEKDEKLRRVPKFCVQKM